MMFDPYKKRFRGYEPDMLKFYLGTEYDATRPMGNVAVHKVNDVLGAWLVGLHQEIAPVLPKALLWLDGAIAEGEDFGPDFNGHRSKLCAYRALGGWLQDGSACHALWNEAAISQRASWLTDGGVWPDATVREYGLEPVMAYLLQAGDAFDGPETAVALYERYSGQAKPPTLKALRRPRQFAYLLALHVTGRQTFDPIDMVDAGRRVLTLNLQDKWLGNGQLRNAAIWLKLTYAFQAPPLTPLQTILKAYDNMPKVPWPDFMARDEGAEGI